MYSIDASVDIRLCRIRAVTQDTEDRPRGGKKKSTPFYPESSQNCARDRTLRSITDVEPATERKA